MLIRDASLLYAHAGLHYLPIESAIVRLTNVHVCDKLL